MSVHAWRFGLLSVVAVILSGCTDDGGSINQPNACLVQAMDATGLTSGVMVYSRKHGDGVSLRQGVFPLAGTRAALPMASLTKPLVAHQILRQVDAGRMRLDQPVAELLPVHAQEAVAGVTVRQLLQHQAGYDRTGHDPLFASAVPDCQRAARYVLSKSPEQQPGSRVIYSNAGYCVLGEILQRHGWAGDLLPVLGHPLGAAGGWVGSVETLNALLMEQLPLRELPSTHFLPDGSYYTYGWRFWPQRSVLRWTHFGRLPGMVSVAASDGRQSMLVAHFSGDPGNYEAVALAFLDDVERCFDATGLAQ